MKTLMLKKLMLDYVDYVTSDIMSARMCQNPFLVLGVVTHFQDGNSIPIQPIILHFSLFPVENYFIPNQNDLISS